MYDSYFKAGWNSNTDSRGGQTPVFTCDQGPLGCDCIREMS